MRAQVSLNVGTRNVARRGTVLAWKESHGRYRTKARAIREGIDGRYRSPAVSEIASSRAGRRRRTTTMVSLHSNRTNTNRDVFLAASTYRAPPPPPPRKYEILRSKCECAGNTLRESVSPMRERQRERERTETRVWSTARRREDRGIIAEGPPRVALAKKS